MLIASLASWALLAVAVTSLLTISAPRFASPDQAAHMHYYGDSLCELGIDWYFRLGDGDYKKILNRWGIASGAISNPVINGATS